MAGMYYTPSEACSTCASDAKWQWFFHKFMRYKAMNDPTFAARVLSSDRICDNWDDCQRCIYAYSEARCVNGNEEDCDHSKHCCRYLWCIGFQGQNPLYPEYYVKATYASIDTYTMIPECPPNCSDRCFQEPKGLEVCDMPCDYGEWSASLYHDLYTACNEQCTARVEYKKREVVCNYIHY